MIVKVADARFVTGFIMKPEGQEVIAEPTVKVQGVNATKFPIRVPIRYLCHLEFECGDVEKSVMIDFEFHSPEGKVPDFAPIVRDYTIPARSTGLGFQGAVFTISLDEQDIPRPGTYKMVVGIESQTVCVTPLEAMLSF